MGRLQTNLNPGLGASWLYGWTGGSFNLSELWLPLLYPWDPLTDFPKPEGGMNEVAFESCRAQSARAHGRFQQALASLPARGALQV